MLVFLQICLICTSRQYRPPFSLLESMGSLVCHTRTCSRTMTHTSDPQHRECDWSQVNPARPPRRPHGTARSQSKLADVVVPCATFTEFPSLIRHFSPRKGHSEIKNVVVLPGPSKLSFNCKSGCKCSDAQLALVTEKMPCCLIGYD